MAHVHSQWALIAIRTKYSKQGAGACLMVAIFLGMCPASGNLAKDIRYNQLLLLSTMLISLFLPAGADQGDSENCNGSGAEAPAFTLNKS